MKPLSSSLSMALAGVLAMSVANRSRGQSTEPAQAPPGPAAPIVDPLASSPQLQALDPGRPRLGELAKPSAATRELYQQFVKSIADPDNTLDLVAGIPRLLILKQPPKRVQIPDESIASYDILSDKEISVAGKTVGTTVLNLWFDDPTAPDGQRLLSYLVRVFPDPQAAERLNRIYGALETEINKVFPDCHVELSALANNLIVRGTVRDAAEASQVLRVLQESIPNAVVDIPFETSESAVPNPQDPVVPTIRQFLSQGTAPEGGNRRASGTRTRLINLLRIRGTNQVMLRVTVAEVNRSAARSIGLNFAIKDAAGNVIFQNTTGGLATFSTGLSKSVTSIQTSANLPMIFDGGQVAVALNALRTLNLSKSLAEPNLVAVNGHNASFQAGGEFPVPVVTGATATGLQSVQFIPFGVQLNFTPNIMEDGCIRLSVSGNVSTRDNADSAIIGNTSVPSVNTRNFQTTVDLRSGQTFAVAGLIQQNSAGSTSHIPGIGDLPFLANLLGSSSTSAAEQELVILVSTDLVEPLDDSKVPPLPGHDMIDPNDVEFFLRGRLESRYPRDSRPALQSDWERIVKYQTLQKELIIGPSGYSDGRTPTIEPAPGGAQ